MFLESLTGEGVTAGSIVTARATNSADPEANNGRPICICFVGVFSCARLLLTVFPKTSERLPSVRDPGAVTAGAPVGEARGGALDLAVGVGGASGDTNGVWGRS